ncbi:MAG: (2Fe-2S)-binding protein [Thermoleophilia bacterium]|nr:(2Fe-2S)-binding protein [Thermoleophilia bacterium]
MDQVVRLVVNGDAVTARVESDWNLLRLLREGLGLQGTKEGCGAGECGACTVILDGAAVNSCIFPAVAAEGAEVVTVEGLAAPDGTLHPLQQQFIDKGAVQCGFCTPGMLLSAKALLDRIPDPTEHQIKSALAGNLCRCTGYNQIIEAVQAAAADLAATPAAGARASSETEEVPA